MKIRIITFHTPLNYGAVLQAYALQTYLLKICDDVKIIDYKPNSLIEKYRYFSQVKSIKSIIKNMIKIKDYKKYKSKKNKYSIFSNKYLILTDRVVNKMELEKLEKNIDFIFTGSDQVFNPTRKNENEVEIFYLNFNVNSAKRVAYAPSFGLDNIPENKKELVKNYLKQFDYLSVRETNGINIVSELINKKPLCVVDPVILLENSDWKKIEKKVNTPEKYLLCYSLYKSEYEKEVVKYISKELNLKVLLITSQDIPKIKYDMCFKNIGPSEFIYLLRNASYVVTDSFHGIVFSTIFKKNFSITIVNQETKSRMISYLTQIDLLDRICNKEQPIKYLPINYAKVSEILEKRKEDSKKYINDCLNNKTNI